MVLCTKMIFYVVYWLPRLFYAKTIVFLKTTIMDERCNEVQSFYMKTEERSLYFKLIQSRVCSFLTLSTR